MICLKMQLLLKGLSVPKRIDIGHIDIEYIWFLKKATEKIPIEGRHVNEAEKQESFDIPEELAQSYQESIILEIKE